MKSPSPGPLPFPLRCHQIKVSDWLPHPPKVAGDIKRDIDCEFGLAIMQSQDNRKCCFYSQNLNNVYITSTYFLLFKLNMLP